MAKTKDSKPETGSTLVLDSTSDSAALAALAELGIDDDAADGLAEVSASDFRTPVKLFNIHGRKDASGNPVTQDMFYDSVTEAAKPKLRLALLEIHKTNAYTVFDSRENITRRVCTSFDCVTGTMEDGTTRPCKGCPDKQWRMNSEGKRVLPCAEVWNTFALDLDERAVTMLRFKRTSMDGIRNYVQAHHYGKRPLKSGGRGNVPLFVYEVSVTLKMDRSGRFATPMFERGDLLPVDSLKVLAETARGVRESLAERMADAEQSTEQVDTSFDTETYDTGGGNGGASEGKFINEPQ